jgi:hypothetical protein
MTNRPRDLFNLLRCVGHPASRSFLSFAKRYCDAYRNDFGWVTTGAAPPTPPTEASQGLRSYTAVGAGDDAHSAPRRDGR